MNCKVSQVPLGVIVEHTDDNEMETFEGLSHTFLIPS